MSIESRQEGGSSASTTPVHIISGPNYVSTQDTFVLTEAGTPDFCFFGKVGSSVLGDRSVTDVARWCSGCYGVAASEKCSLVFAAVGARARDAAHRAARGDVHFRFRV